MNNLYVRSIGGTNVAFVVPDIPDDAPEHVREGIARRNVMAAGEPCPCGAMMPRPNRAARRAARKGQGPRVQVADVHHEPSCPATDENLLPAIRKWRAER